MTSRERVLRCLERDHPDRPPRHTWWLPIAEIDRQRVLPYGSEDDARAAVRRVADAIHDPAGGVIAQFEFGAACRLANAHAVHDEWSRIATRQP